MLTENGIMSRWHVCEHIRINGSSTESDIATDLHRSSRKVNESLHKLMKKGFIGRIQVKHKNHMRYNYFLTKYAETWLRKNNMRSFLETKNPFLPSLVRVAKMYNRTRREKCGIVHAKKVEGFYDVKY